jgi:phosphoribosyl 1,2-cyclic phosphate phosphodiesterase
MNASFLFLGTGGSLGVPVIGCDCEVCQSDSSYNKRLRPCALIRYGSKNFVIDPGPDFREQALRYGVSRMDGVLATHSHHDHTAGLDDLRIYNAIMRQPLPLVMSEETYLDLKKRFAYIFDPIEQPKSLVSKFDIQILKDFQGVELFQNFPLGYTSYYQTGMKVTGFRIGDLAYFSDIKDYKNEVFDLLQGVNTLIVSALRYTSSPMHFTVDEAIDFINKSGVEKAYLTHISHELEHQRTNSYLPKHIRMAYDGLEINFTIN